MRQTKIHRKNKTKNYYCINRRNIRSQQSKTNTNLNFQERESYKIILNESRKATEDISLSIYTVKKKKEDLARLEVKRRLNRTGPKTELPGIPNLTETLED